MHSSRLTLTGTITCNHGVRGHQNTTKYKLQASYKLNVSNLALCGSPIVGNLFTGISLSGVQKSRLIKVLSSQGLLETLLM